MTAPLAHLADPDRLTRLSAALLALLIERPAHAYDLWGRCETRFGATMHVSRAKVYHECRQLLAKGLIEEIEDEAAVGRRQQRYPYRVTALGARLHRERLVGALRDEPHIVAMHERMLSVGPDDARALLAVVERLEEDCLEAAADLPTSTGDMSLRDELIAEHRRLVLTAQADFAKSARRIIEARS